MEHYRGKLHISESTYFRRLREFKKLPKDDIEKTTDTGETKIPEVYPDELTFAYIEHQSLRAKSREEIDRIKMLLDILYKKDRILKTTDDSDTIKIEDQDLKELVKIGRSRYVGSA